MAPAASRCSVRASRRGTTTPAATACGFHAGYGVANSTLPCGTKVTFRYGGRTVTAVVDDRGPFVGGREWDLNQNTAGALGFGGVATVWSTRVVGSHVRYRGADPGRASGRRLAGRRACCMAALRRPSRHGRVLRLGRAATAAGAPRAAGDRRRHRSARGRHDGVLRGTPLRRRLGDAGLPGAPAVSRWRLPRARLRVLPRGLARGHGDRPRARADGRGDRPRRGLPRAHRDSCAASQTMRALSAEIERRPASHARSGSARTSSWRRWPRTPRSHRGFVVLTREEACAPLRRGAVRAGTGNRAEDGRAAAAFGIARSGELAARRPRAPGGRVRGSARGRAAATGAVRGRRRPSPRSAR